VLIKKFILVFEKAVDSPMVGVYTAYMLIGRRSAQRFVGYKMLKCSRHGKNPAALL